MKLIKAIIFCFLIIFLVSGCFKEAEDSAEVVEELPEVEISPGVSKSMIRLTEEKTIVPDSLNIRRGEGVKWVNEDQKGNHNLVIHPADIERPTSNDIIVKSGNIAPGNSWSYTFEESGIYTVKDIYSGTMRGEITVS